MPRQARIDAPGALHHVIARGLERRPIFSDERDRRDFLERLEKAFRETRTPCYAWALLPNHLHLLLETGDRPVGRVMQSVLTGYALAFNRRHDRAGHLFQNRFKSVLCERETYFLELVRYIHLNPLRAGLARTMAALDRHPWSGHAVILGNREAPFQAADAVLARFGRRAAEARQRYRAFIEDGVSGGRRLDLSGGGLVRSLGGWESVIEARRGGERQAYDERILGSGDFVERVLKEAGEREPERGRLRRAGWTSEKILEHAAKSAGIRVSDLRGSGRTEAQSRGRALASLWLVEGLGESGASAARRLSLTKAAVRKAIDRAHALGTRFSI